MGKSKGDSTILHHGELNVMELLWANGSLPANRIAAVIKDFVGWEKNTTYTVIKRLIDKGAVRRTDPGYICTPLISKESVQKIETEVLLDRVYDGSLVNLINGYIAKEELSAEEVDALYDIVMKYREF
jgi:BlaI family penicillinase repressor